MKNIFLTVIFFISALSIQAQKYMTQNGVINFYSKTPIENIEATNNQASSVFDIETGGIATSLLVKAFVFEKALMQEHFNEKYVESEKFPKSTFKGIVENYNTIKLSSSASEVSLKGQLSIHGVTKDIEAKGTMTKIDDSTLKAQFIFVINPTDYGIKIPSTVQDKISDSIKITTSFTYKKL